MDVQKAIELAEQIPGQLTLLRHELSQVLSQLAVHDDCYQRGAIKLRTAIREQADEQGKPAHTSEKARDEEFQRRRYQSQSLRQRELKTRRLEQQRRLLEAAIDELSRQFRAAIAMIEYWTAQAGALSTKPTQEVRRARKTSGVG